jgi:hypothetical protein
MLVELKVLVEHLVLYLVMVLAYHLHVKLQLGMKVAAQLTVLDGKLLVLHLPEPILPGGIRLLYQDQDKLMSYFLDLQQQLTLIQTIDILYFGRYQQPITFVMAHLLGHSPHENITYRNANNT